MAGPSDIVRWKPRWNPLAGGRCGSGPPGLAGGPGTFKSQQRYSNTVRRCGEARLKRTERADSDTPGLRK